MGGDPEEGWVGSSPPPFALVHLTNMWHAFPHHAYSKVCLLFYAEKCRYLICASIEQIVAGPAIYFVAFKIRWIG